jgi:hypothetical protein
MTISTDSYCIWPADIQPCSLLNSVRLDVARDLGEQRDSVVKPSDASLPLPCEARGQRAELIRRKTPPLS